MAIAADGGIGHEAHSGLVQSDPGESNRCGDIGVLRIFQGCLASTAFKENRLAVEMIKVDQVFCQ